MTDVTRVRYTELAELLAPVGARRQRLPGFEDEFVDIVDYIIRITHRIWEQKRVERILDYYEPEVRIHTMSGEIVGAEAVVTNTEETLKAFPDRTLWGDDVIWSKEKLDDFYSSHRIVSNMTNLGDSEFGPATGKPATVITIADCAVRNNRIHEEWLVRDRLGLALQLGLDPQAMAPAVARAQTPESKAYLAGQRANTQAAGGGVARDVRMAAVLRELWHGDFEAALRRYYRPTLVAQLPGARRVFGRGELAAFWHHLRGCCLAPCFSADHFCETPPDLDGKRAMALRWRVSARGKENDKPVYILGVTHWQLLDDRVTEEWTVFDGLALLSQLAEV